MKIFGKTTITLLLTAILLFAMALPVFADVEGTEAAGGTTRAITQEAEAADTDDADSENKLAGNKALAAGLAISISAGLGALGMGLATSKAAESISRQPEAEGKIRTTFMLGLVFIETAIIYALLTVILIIFVI